MDWKSAQTQIVYKSYPFHVEEVTFTQPEPRRYQRLICPDWVNVLPITTDRKALLIRQPRVGSANHTLETPGGAVDSEEKDFAMAALRELEEETGYTSQRIIPLASINPNPALMNNKVHYFLAFNCFPNPDRRHFPDPSEEITNEFIPITELDKLVRTGQIDHSLSALCIMMAFRYLDSSANHHLAGG